MKEDFEKLYAGWLANKVSDSELLHHILDCGLKADYKLIETKINERICPRLSVRSMNEVVE